MATTETTTDFQKEKHTVIQNLKGALEILDEYVDEILSYIRKDEIDLPTEEEQRMLLKDLVRVTDKIDAAIDPLDVWINGDPEHDNDEPEDGWVKDDPSVSHRGERNE